MASQTTSLAFQGFMQQWHSWEAMVLFCSIVTEVAYCARYRGSWVRGADKGRHRCGQSVAQPAAPKPTESKGIPSLPMPDPAVLSSLLPPPAKSPSPNTHPHPVLSASTSRSCSPNPRLGRSIVRSTTPRSYFLLRKARGRPRVTPSPPSEPPRVRNRSCELDTLHQEARHPRHHRAKRSQTDGRTSVQLLRSVASAAIAPAVVACLVSQHP